MICYQKLLEILYAHGSKYPDGEQARENDEGAMAKEWPPLFGDFNEPQIEASRIIEKLQYRGWHCKKNFVEWCFLDPLEAAFKLIRKNMFVLYMQGRSKFSFEFFIRKICGGSLWTRT